MNAGRCWSCSKIGGLGQSYAHQKHRVSKKWLRRELEILFRLNNKIQRPRSPVCCILPLDQENTPVALARVLLQKHWQRNSMKWHKGGPGFTSWLLFDFPVLKGKGKNTNTAGELSWPPPENCYRSSWVFNLCCCNPDVLGPAPPGQTLSLHQLCSDTAEEAIPCQQWMELVVCTPVSTTSSNSFFLPAQWPEQGGAEKLSGLAR